MRYGISTTAFFGVMLSWKDTDKLAKVIKQRVNTLGLKPDKDEDESFEDVGLGVFEQFEALMYHQEPSLEEEEYGYIVMIAEDTDSRIHNTSFEEGANHGVGFLIADKGYGSQTTSKAFAAKMKEDVSRERELFAKLIQSLLDEANIKEEPGLNVVSYTA